MRILLLATAFNSLTQRLHVALREDRHTLSVALDVNEARTLQAVERFGPDVLVAPYLRRAIPESVLGRVRCLVVHPGPPGDRGPAALDWAILDNAAAWGVTVLEATAELDAGPVWSHRAFALRRASKSSLYRAEVADGAVEAVREALSKIQGGGSPVPSARLADDAGQWRPAVPDDRRRLDWRACDAAEALRRIRSADGQPGVETTLFETPCRIYDAHLEPTASGPPGAVLGWRDDAVLVAAREGGLWIGAARPEPVAGERGFKQPATLAFADRLRDIVNLTETATSAYRPIQYVERGSVGRLRFDFYNGAMSTTRCKRLLRAVRDALQRPTRVLALDGGTEFWSNGMDLNSIEADDSPADASMTNIEAIDDVAEAILRATDKVVVASLNANAGAGGVFLALAADRVVARRGVVLNPHYKNMGNLYGSEYWTYVLPKRVGAAGVDAVMAGRLPMGVEEACRHGLVDDMMEGDRAAVDAAVWRLCRRIAEDKAFETRIAQKAADRERDEAERPLAAYRAAELAEMRRNFFGFDSSYHVARYEFVTKRRASRTPSHLSEEVPL